MIDLVEPLVGDRERDAVAAVLDSGQLTDGPEVRAFQDEFADFCGTDHAVGTANGTTALHAALVGLDVGDGDEVLTTPFSFVATANAARLVGATPVFVDIDPQTYAVDPDAVEDYLRANGGDVAAIVAVHLYGLPADLPRLRELADEYDVALVEDAAQAHGAAVDGDTVGSVGDVGCFSFYPTKNMTAAEGGMVTTDDEAVRDRVRRYVNHGRSDDYRHVDVGHNFRMTDLSAAIGRVQLDRLPAFTRARRRNARLLDEALADAPVTTPVEPDGRRHVYHQYTVRADRRDELAGHLERAGVDTGIYYPTPIHKQPAYADYGGTYERAEAAAESVLSLPVYPGISSDEIRAIGDAVGRFYA